MEIFEDPVARMAITALAVALHRKGASEIETFLNELAHAALSVNPDPESEASKSILRYIAEVKTVFGNARRQH